jgi:hypothetical protein
MPLNAALSPPKFAYFSYFGKQFLAIVIQERLARS